MGSHGLIPCEPMRTHHSSLLTTPPSVPPAIISYLFFSRPRILALGALALSPHPHFCLCHPANVSQSASTSFLFSPFASDYACQYVHLTRAEHTHTNTHRGIISHRWCIHTKPSSSCCCRICSRPSATSVSHVPYALLTVKESSFCCCICPSGRSAPLQSGASAASAAAAAGTTATGMPFKEGRAEPLLEPYWSSSILHRSAFLRR
jgi:hypothetical protein